MVVCLRRSNRQGRDVMSSRCPPNCACVRMYILYTLYCPCLFGSVLLYCGRISVVLNTGKKQLVSFRRVVRHSEQLHVVEVGHAGVLRMRTIVAQSPHFVSEIGNKSVPIQLTQCWFPGLAISSAKI